MAEAWTVPRLWDGERVFVIAGGQSVPRTYLRENRLAGRVLAVKDAVFLYDAPDCLFYADPHDMHAQRPEIFRAYRGDLIVKRAVHEGIPARIKQVRRMFTDKRKAARIQGLSLDPAMLGGWDSGGSAINLAFHLGAREIVLIGFDLTGRHWNPGHPLPNASIATHRRHRESIDAMAFALKAQGVAAWNTSPMSTLRNYPHADLASFV